MHSASLAVPPALFSAKWPHRAGTMCSHLTQKANLGRANLRMQTTNFGPLCAPWGDPQNTEAVHARRPKSTNPVVEATHGHRACNPKPPPQRCSGWPPTHAQTQWLVADVLRPHHLLSGRKKNHAEPTWPLWHPTPLLCAPFLSKKRANLQRKERLGHKP